MCYPPFSLDVLHCMKMCLPQMTNLWRIGAASGLDLDRAVQRLWLAVNLASHRLGVTSLRRQLQRIPPPCRLGSRRGAGASKASLLQICHPQSLFAGLKGRPPYLVFDTGDLVSALRASTGDAKS